MTLDKSTLKDHRRVHEYQVLARLAALLPAGVRVCIVADRGFGDQKLYRMPTEAPCFGYVVCFSSNITVTGAARETRAAAERARAGGAARGLPGAKVTADRYRTHRCPRSASGDEAWCLAPGTDTAAK